MSAIAWVNCVDCVWSVAQPGRRVEAIDRSAVPRLRRQVGGDTPQADRVRGVDMDCEKTWGEESRCEFERRWGGEGSTLGSRK